MPGASSLSLSKDQKEFWKKKAGSPVSFKTVVDGAFGKSYLPWKLISAAESTAMEKLGYAAQLGKHFGDAYSDKPRALAKKIFQVTMNDNGDFVLSSPNGSLTWNNAHNSWE